MRKIICILAALIAVVVALPATAQLCSPAVITAQGIGDGCTTSYGTSTAGNILLPSVGIFKSTFTPACNAHDKCYTTLGTTYNECDSNFLSSMRGACSSTYPPFLVPDVYASCVTTAELYYGGVTAYEAIYNPLPGLQELALQASYSTATAVNADQCGTSPAMTTLYDPSLINQINSTFQANANRLPTIYEFLDAVNAGYGTGNDVVLNPTVWNSTLIQKAIAAASSLNTPPPATVTLARTGGNAVGNIVMTATPVPNTHFQWKINGSVYGAPPNPSVSTLSIQLDQPLNAETEVFSGFMKATGLNGARNMALVSVSLYIIGQCNNKPGGPCR